MSKVYIGIDPGQSGGLAAIYPKEVYCESMPKTEMDINKWLRHNTAFNHDVIAIIEHVHAMPKQGVSSTFKFGMGYGGLRMCLVCNEIPFRQVTPRTWQKEFVTAKKKNETKTQFKNRLKAAAQQLFPQENVTLKTADALLIAEYCRRTWDG